MATEYLYQPLILHGAMKGVATWDALSASYRTELWASEYYCGKRIPAMNDRGDAVKMLEFVALPRGIVKRISVDVDTRRTMAEDIVDIVGIEANVPPSWFKEMGGIESRDLRVWTRPGDSTSIIFPNAKEANG